ncbi:MAG: isoprenylcysteine carboxylmethyltransferase family protein [Chloroflexi bacterium]|jgi:protein-S-isoprenylcysteine O-methyltransferase Ste14|nr:isoprenylcysteine carboxylmethyltransferase family protein [Chloroflexota bacterium]
MSTWIRHALSILLLPFLVVVVVPCWLRRTFSPSGTPLTTLGWLPRLAGVVLFTAGLLLFGWCVLLFARIGRGTLAPWDPTRYLVAAGPYRFVRNPMISGVALMLLGQAAFWASRPLTLWAGLFILVNHLYFILSEEPGLERRFGDAYRAYKAAVPRWLPRLRL